MPSALAVSLSGGNEPGKGGVVWVWVSEWTWNKNCGGGNDGSWECEGISSPPYFSTLHTGNCHKHVVKNSLQLQGGLVHFTAAVARLVVHLRAATVAWPDWGDRGNLGQVMCSASRFPKKEIPNISLGFNFMLFLCCHLSLKLWRNQRFQESKKLNFIIRW